MIVDAHQHYWQLARGDYAWLTPSLGPLYRDFLPDALAPELAATGVAATVLVQAAPTTAETRFLARLAQATPTIAGVVGWADMQGSTAPGQIAALAEACGPVLKGLRPMIQDLPDPAWVVRSDLDPAFAALESMGLAFDALVHTRHLAPLLRRLEYQPDLRVVIDHCGKPDIAADDFAGWAAGMRNLARNTGALCKLSGLLTQLGDTQSLDDARRYVDWVLTEFGPERLLWGSDWPVLTLRGTYQEWFAASERLLDGLDAAQRAAVMGGNAIRFYKLAIAPAEDDKGAES